MVTEISSSHNLSGQSFDEIDRLVAVSSRREQRARLIYFGWIVSAVILLCVVAVVVSARFRKLDHELTAESERLKQLSEQLAAAQQRSAQLAAQLADQEKRLQEFGKMEKRVTDLEQRAGTIQSTKADVAMVRKELGTHATLEQFDQLSNQLKNQLATKASTAEVSNLSSQIRGIESRLVRVEIQNQPNHVNDSKETTSDNVTPATITTKGLSWVSRSRGAPLPSDAFVGGWANTSTRAQPFFICRAKHGTGTVLPGRIWNGFCYFSATHIEHRSTDYEVLVSAQELSWRPAASTDGAVPGGTLRGSRLYLCQAEFGGGLYPGWVTPGEAQCSISYGGAVIHRPAASYLFEVLEPPK